ncbi:uncharacterized protein LOC100186284 [Ciona intestinalis]
MKVICAGLPKTGTKSLARALRLLDYNAVYDYEEAIEFAFDDWEKIWNNQSTDVDSILEKIYSKNVEAVVDMPHSYHFEEFLKRWPSAKVILMLREEDSWFASFKNMLEQAERDHKFYQFLQYICPTSKRLTRWHENMFLSTFGSKKPNPKKWKSAYRRHVAYVKSVVPKDQLLIYNIKQGWDPICEFLEKKIPDQPFPVENKAGSKTSIAERMINDSSVVKQIEFEAKLFFGALSVVVAAISIYFFL